MLIIENPDKETYNSLLARPTQDFSELYPKVKNILDSVKLNGDAALRQYALDFDNVLLDTFEVDFNEWQAEAENIPNELKNAIDQAYENIKTFHSAQFKPQEDIIETMPGVKCWRKSVAIDKVGFYIPGGTAPLFSTVLMLGVPAQIVNCPERILCSPSSHPAIYYAAKKVGINRIFKIGGAQAIAAMAYGTEQVPQVYKIFGPGNQFVTLAKQLVSAEGVAIDMPAGPSEVAIFADETSIPAFVASDLLSQAEHGVDSQVLLVSTSIETVTLVKEALENQLNLLPRKNLAEKALENSKAILVANKETAIEILNSYAAEHLILATENYTEILNKITNAGSIFLGNYTPESCGDYASGTNHTLPTNGFARAYSGVSVDSFIKKITVQEINKEGLLNLGSTVEIMSEAEGLNAHKNAVTLRLNSLK